ncbi:hypothetical protein HK099_006512 [Clydaea vesicula]|uniref:AAA-ATPase-like domain-containing protein n=1 Tax=Clydaea vesicula TaxID=447962 RepID=A0AAD5TXW4_9FUNG|nr:hypothetical protein HK099_006512 [Clydaea vesicula]
MNQIHVVKGNKLPIGIDSFRCLIANKYSFVDKTLLIHEFIKSSSLVSLILRPRRFGKSLNLSMLRYFFEKVPAETPSTINRRGLFSGLLIEQNHIQLFDTHFAKYPCIYLSLKGCKANSWKHMLRKLRNLISDIYSKHIYLESFLDDYEFQRFKSVLNCFPDFTESSLMFLSKILTKYHGSRCVVLIDEYDAPMEWAYNNNSENSNHEGYDFLNNAKSFFELLFSNLLKSNDSNIHQALMVGVVRVARSGFLSGFDNYCVYPMFSDRFSNHFGFREEETQTLLQYHPIPPAFNEIKQWYNSFHAGNNISLYNPWSIVNICEKKTLKSYSVETGGTKSIESLFELVNDDFKLNIASLINGNIVPRNIQKDVYYETLQSSPEESLWPLLYYAGYLTANSNGVKIPNLEVRLEWEGWFSRILTSKFPSLSPSSLLDLIINGHSETFVSKFPIVLQSCLTYFDVGGSDSGKKAEYFYHAFCLGLFVHARDKSFNVSSELPAGTGRFDVTITPPSAKDYAAILEFKVVKGGESIDVKSQEALDQIDLKSYRASIPPHVNKLMEIGIAFKGNSSHVVVRKLEKDGNDIWNVV